MTQRSLTLNLMAWAMGALLLVWGSSVALGYRTGLREADQLTDGHLASVAHLQLTGFSPDSAGPNIVSALPGMADLQSHHYQSSMSLVVWDASGKVLMRSGEAVAVPFSQSEGFETLQLGSPPVAWRSFSRWDGPSHERKVSVLLSESERDDLAQDIAEQVTEPGFWLLPVVALALGLAIHRGLRPLYQLAQDVDALDIRQVSPLQNAYQQAEFQAVVNSINTLASRYHAAVSRERDLASELAHELRTPLASVTLQARALRQVLPDLQRTAILNQLEREALRAGQVLNDLLALARASRTELAEARQPLDLDAIAHEELASFAQAAHRSNHELALLSTEPFRVMGHPVLLSLALRNLLENALSHTPPGTQVMVQLDAGGGWIQVCDNAGLSLPPGKRGVHLPHGAALGLGLGHRVVEKIAHIHGAVFAQVAAPQGFTSCYRLSFPTPLNTIV